MKPLLDLPDTADVYLTTAELADYLKYAGPHRAISAHKWIVRHGVPKHYRSERRVLVKRADVDRVLAA